MPRASCIQPNGFIDSITVHLAIDNVGGETLDDDINDDNDDALCIHAGVHNSRLVSSKWWPYFT